jgi:hypothetical protein
MHNKREKERIMEKLAELAVAVVLAVALTGNLDRFTTEVRIATLKLMKASQTSNWGSPLVLSVMKRGH